jgi:superfamily II DNA helicase RecQ
MTTTLNFFSVPALSPATAQAELNLFMQQHRVVHVEKQWVADGAASFWSLCITVVVGAGALPQALRAPSNSVGTKSGTAKIDYRDVLEPADFAVFAELRNLRAATAQAEGVPPYALFSNEQLACMVRERVITATQLRAIDGVGEARVSKYAAGFLALLQNAFAPTPEVPL